MAVVGAETASLEAAAAFTVMAPVTPVIEAVVVSVAAMVWLPAVFKVAWKLPTPLASVELLGNTACASELVNFIVPE